jgi:hypothetical protein
LFSNHIVHLLNMGIKMQLLTSDEIIQVAGGDAAATRQSGQNSWGEWPSGGEPASEPSPIACLWDLVQGIFSGHFRADCP